MKTLVWFHYDLRLSDNEPLYTAAKMGTVIPVFVYDVAGPYADGTTQRWWLHHSLRSLQMRLANAGSNLIIRSGNAARVIDDLVGETEADAVHWHTRYEPHLRKRDELIRQRLEKRGVTVRCFNPLLHDPETLLTSSGTPYRVFTPFWRKLRDTVEVARPLPMPRLKPIGRAFDSEPIDALGLIADSLSPEIAGLWTPGEEQAERAATQFGKSGLAEYDDLRDVPARDGTSTLSPHLRFGEISTRDLWYTLSPQGMLNSSGSAAAPFLRQIVWREFAYHLLYHFPDTTTKPLNPRFERFPWQRDKSMLSAWQSGRTGYPIVDAGMRQLARTGWMHNRVRMIVASFLTKHLLQPWQEGADWFWEWLLDADLANNTMGWQWVAGSGADAQPYFRIFNPTLQGAKFDPKGDYVRNWVPELADVPKRYIHEPWNASSAVLENAGVVLGETYPHPIVDHRAARLRALEAYSGTKESVVVPTRKSIAK